MLLFDFRLLGMANGFTFAFVGNAFMLPALQPFVFLGPVKQFLIRLHFYCNDESATGLVKSYHLSIQKYYVTFIKKKIHHPKFLSRVF